MRCIAFALALAGCAFNVEPRMDPDVAPTDCAAACERLEALECEEAEPTPNGTTCVQVCRNTENSPITLNPACVVGIATCEQIEDCVDGLD